MRILGIDPGTHATGFGVIDWRDGRVRHVCHGVVRTKASDPLWERLRTIHRRIADTAVEHRPDALAIESCFVSKNVQTALKLGHTRGVVILACLEVGADIHEYAPSEVKKAVTGTGRADKNQVAQMVRTILGLSKAPPSDASDALAVAICHAHSVRAATRLRSAR